MSVCTLVGLLGGLFLVGWTAFAFHLWRGQREASRRHKEQLRRCSTEELVSRAWNWGPLEHYADTPAVKQFRSLLEQRRYEEMLQGWRALSLALFALAEDTSAAGPEFFDSDTHRTLRDYVEVLLERQQRGE
jgi:hypothetical protein